MFSSAVFAGEEKFYCTLPLRGRLMSPYGLTAYCMQSHQWQAHVPPWSASLLHAITSVAGTYAPMICLPIACNHISGRHMCPHGLPAYCMLQHQWKAHEPPWSASLFSLTQVEPIRQHHKDPSVPCIGT